MSTLSRTNWFVLFATSTFITFAYGGEGISYWDVQRRGANGDGNDATLEWFSGAKKAGIEYVRLSVVEMPPANRDFLLGDADVYTGIPKQDLDALVEVLDSAVANGVEVVLTMFSLPGCRWQQQNENRFDYRLWHSEQYQQQAAGFWRNLAKALRDHPAIAGYNILNEPAPEREFGFEEPSDDLDVWLKSNAGGPSDLNRFYAKMIAAIREVDSVTPIILDGRFHATPSGWQSLTPVDDDAVLYSFHFYEPWNFTTNRVNKGRFSYPDRMPVGWSGETTTWGKDAISREMAPMSDWATEHSIAQNRILLGEFGCNRQVGGVAEYLQDVMNAANELGWHWAFYSYRSNSWDGMDYELGTRPLGEQYWKELEQGTPHEQLIQRDTNPVWQVMQDAISANPAND